MRKQRLQWCLRATEGFLSLPTGGFKTELAPIKIPYTIPQQQSLHDLLSSDSPGLGFPQGFRVTSGPDILSFYFLWRLQGDKLVARAG